MRENVLPLVFVEKTFARVFILLFAGLVNASVACAAEIPKASPRDSRLGELNYEHDQVFQIRVAKGIATQIVLAPGEKIVRSAPGSAADCRQELSEWCIVANVGSDELYVQPRTPSAPRNNLQLTTNKRRYSFDFVLAAASADGSDAWFRVIFHYPEAAVSAEGAFGGKRCNWNYSMSRARSATEFAPLAVFDDGIETYLLMPPDSPVPEMRGNTEGMRLQRVPGMRDNRLLVLPGVHDKLVIGYASAALTIWNAASSSAASPSACPGW